MEDIITLIQNFGFPIACTVALFIMLRNEMKSHKEETEEMTKTHIQRQTHTHTKNRYTHNDSDTLRETHTEREKRIERHTY